MGGPLDKVADFSAKLDPTGVVGKFHEKIGVGEQDKKKKKKRPAPTGKTLFSTSDTVLGGPTASQKLPGSSSSSTTALGQSLL